MKPLTKCILLSVSVIAIMLPKKAARACGFYIWPGEYRFWLLQPDLTNQPDLTPFYFASTYLYRQDINAARESYPQQNIQEWYDEIKRNAAKKDIDTLLNETDPQYFFDTQQQLAKANSFMRYLMKPQNRELFRYVTISKKVEQIAANPDPWEEDYFPNNNISQVIEEAEALYAQTHAQFIKLRTAFQLMRLYARNGRQEYANEIYDRWIEPVKTKSWIKTAALYEKAINANGFERDYLLSKVFDKGGYRKTYCLTRFNTEWLDSTLLLARNNHERNVLKAMKVFKYPGRSLHIMKGIYRSEPAYKELPFLLLREINKVEDWLVTSRVTGFGMPAVYGTGYFDNYSYHENVTGNYKKDKAYAKELYNFLLQMISDQKSSQSALLHLYAAHLCLLNEDYTASAGHLQQAKAVKDLPRNVQAQIGINTYLMHLENGFDEATENEFMYIIKSGNQRLGIYDADIMKNQLVLYTARKMIQKGDRVRGLMLLSRTNRALGQLSIGDYKMLYQEIEDVAEEKDYDQILQLLHKTNKNAFEQFITISHFRSPWENYYSDGDQLNGEIMWSDNKLRDCKASWYIRHHQLEDALATLQQIPDSFYAQYPYDPFLGGDAFSLNIYHPHTAATEDKRSLTKKQVIAEMIKLQQLATKDKRKAAACYYQLANAWYNMTWHGKNWLMVRQWWSCGDPGEYKQSINKKQFYDDYFGCRQAKQLYLKAMEATTDKKLAALCYYMVQQCEKNNRDYTGAFKSPRWNDGVIKDPQWPDYSGAARKGIDLSYYKCLVKECELYQSFIKQYDKRPWAAN